MARYDSIIIGASPVSMLEAVHRAETGLKTLLIDKAAKLGGAWRTEPCFGLVGVEISPHVMLPNKSAYRIISEKFDVSMLPMTPPPVYIINGKKRLLQKLNTERVIRELATLKGSGNLLKNTIKILAAFYHAIRLSAPKYRTEILYPEDGLNCLLKKADEILSGLNVDVILNQEVISIKYFTSGNSDYKFEITTKSGDKHQSKTMASSAIISIDSIYIDDQYIKPYSYISHSDHITYLIRPGVNGYGFAKFIEDKYFELASDVSDFTPGLTEMYPDCRIITCRFQKRKIFEKNRIPEYFNHLKKTGYLSEKAELVDSYYYSVEDKILASYVIDRISDVFGNNYNFIGSRDLGMTDSLDEFNYRWGFVDRI